MTTTTKKTTTASLTKFVIVHDECEHSGDNERDLADLANAGLAFSTVSTFNCHGPEVGFSVIETRASPKQISDALDKAESCIRGFRKGAAAEARDMQAEEEGDHRHEYGDEDDD